MPAQEFEMQPVSQMTFGAIGPPGRRVFYLQARKEQDLLTVIVEKMQVQSLALGAAQFLKDLNQRFPNLPDDPVDSLDFEVELETPLDPVFRVGQLGLGYDESKDLMVLVARELLDEGADEESASVIRLWSTRAQLRALIARGLDIAQRGRPICGNCGEPIDLEGHFCPKRNGHRH